MLSEKENNRKGSSDKSDKCERRYQKYSHFWKGNVSGIKRLFRKLKTLISGFLLHTFF